MRSSIPTLLKEIIKDKTIKESQSLLNEVKYSNIIYLINATGQEKKVAIPFKWGQVFQLWRHFFYLFSIYVAIPFKWGQVFQLCYGYFIDPYSKMSQSLLNEVKYSNKSRRYISESQLESQSLLNEVKYSNLKVIGYEVFIGNGVAIPFKWGQVFQRIIQLQVQKRFWKKSQSLLNEVKYSNTQTTQTELSDNIKVAIPFKWGQVFQRQAL